MSVQSPTNWALIQPLPFITLVKTTAHHAERLNQSH